MGDRGPKWNQLHRFNPLFRLIELCHLHVAIFGGIAMAWEMLGAQQNIIRRVRVRAFDECRHILCDRLGIFAERTRIDDRVIRIVVDVRIGSEHPCDSERARLARRCRAEISYGFEIVCRPIRHHVGISRRLGNAHGSSAFKVRCEEERSACKPLQVIQEHGHLVWLSVNHMSVVNAIGDDHPPDVYILDPMQEPSIFGALRIQIIAIASNHDQLRDAVVQGQSPRHRQTSAG